MGSTAVVWFRRDLRLHDHPALSRAAERHERVAPLFVLDDTLLGGRWPARNRVWFMARSVAALAAELAARGAPLTVLRGRPAQIVPDFAERVGAGTILVSRDYSPYGRRRDRQVRDAAVERDMELRALAGLLVHEPEEVARPAGGHYSVFSPFHRLWAQAPARPVLPAPERLTGADPSPALSALDDLLDQITPTADVRLLLEPGEPAARRRLAGWASSAALDAYAHGRDRLDSDGTSRLSQDLRWGLLSPVEVLERTAGAGRDRQRFGSELAWRDFYAHLLWHAPRVAQHAYRPELEDVAWRSDEGLIEEWRAGRTGYPVVDAAMRQLLASGWMHNRARMIAASYLTKHLGVDYRVGEAHFMAHLVDGDLASNNGGWQWAASTGTDPQPYFRVFNPTLQGRRHDPNGDYVRRWVPELSSRTDLPGVAVHEPPPGAYIERQVDHAVARRRAIERYEEVTSGRR